MKPQPTTLSSLISQILALLLAVLVLGSVAANARTVCQTQCLADRDLGFEQCNSAYNDCVNAANGDPDLVAVCNAAYEQCIPSVFASYDSCVAACPPLPCSDQCYKDYEPLFAQIEQTYQVCVAGAFGDKGILQICADERAAALAVADSQLQACLAPCPPVGTEPSSWGAVKSLFR